MSRLNLTKTPKKRMSEKLLIAAAPILLAFSMVGCVVDGSTVEETDDPRPRSNVGTQYAAIVIVNAADKANPLSNSDAESMFNKAAAQFAACSGNEMTMVLGDDTVRITLPGSIGEYSSYSVDSDMNMMLCRHYGYSDGCEITKERDLDHVLFSLPFGLSDDKKGVFWAKGSAGDSRRFSVYGGGDYNFEGETFNGGFFVPSTIMHELGHNYRLGHALDPQNNGDSPYGDSTTHMGGSAVTNKCFNGYNYYVLGWHQSQTNEISLSPNVAKRYNIRSISDLSSEGIVNIKVDKYYVTLNLKKGINSQTGEYENQVLINEGKDIHFGQSISSTYHDTRLVENLESPGDRFEAQVTDGTLRIELCSIDTQGSDGAMLSIGLGATNCHTDGPIQHPKGIQNLMSGVPVSGLSGAKNDLLEFKMELSNTPDSVTCSTSGGTGDVDLLVNSMSSPQISYSSGVNSCYSRGTTTNQTCTTEDLKGPDVYVTVDGDDPFSGVTLVCTATGATSVDSDGDTTSELDLCVPGPKVDSSCNSYVKNICDDDPYCCNTRWDNICVGHVAKDSCKQTCNDLCEKDSDQDGTPDCNDECPNDQNKTEEGVCGCNKSDVDSDQDGTPDCNDECPNDENKISRGECDCGVPEGTCGGVTGNGLTGTYFSDTNLSNQVLVRTDSTVNFNWGGGSPDQSIEADYFSVRWTGFVEPKYSETYTFYTLSDDGVRLWVDGSDTPLIDNWTVHGPTEDKNTIRLQAGQRYQITMEFFENRGGATAKLFWSSSSQNKQVIPKEQLFTDNIGCIPKTCSELDARCGSIDDGCGTTLDCGRCQRGLPCRNNQCGFSLVPKLF